MAFQFRVTLPQGVSGEEYATEIARKLEDAAQDVLTGVPPDRYHAAVARYQVLLELMQFAQDTVNKQQEGDPV